MSSTNNADSVLKFWFEDCTPANWFQKDAAFDAKLKDKFEPLIIRAMAGQLDDWSKEPKGCLALILLLDQFTRNIYRDTPRAFSGDEFALVLSLRAVSEGWVESAESAAERQFFLMPMMHSEDIDIQDKSLDLFKKHTNDHVYDYAIKHRDIVARFGHFPHRNAILGRPSTDEEVQFLTQPGSSF